MIRKAKRFLEYLKNPRKEKLGRTILRLGERFHINDALLRYSIKLIKISLRPRNYIVRKHIGRKLCRGSLIQYKIPEDKGYRLFPPDTFTNSSKIISLCQELFNERVNGNCYTGEGQKPFLRNILKQDDFFDYPELVDFALSEPFIEMATDYLKTLPIFVGMYLWWTPQNDTLRSSQMFHQDREDFRQVKFFFNITQVDLGCGPFTLLPADISTVVKKKLSHARGRYTDAEVYRCCRPKNIVQLLGDIGSSAVVDTSRCFHYGSRSYEKERLVLMFSFMTDYEVAESAIRRIPINIKRYEVDPLRLLLLNDYVL